VGISEYWYTSHDVLGLGGVYDFTEYENKATAFCGKDWTLALEDHPDWSLLEIQRYQLQCFKSAWMVNVLHGGIEVPRQGGEPATQQHLDPEQGESWKELSIESVEHKNWNPPFQSIDTINDIQVSWTLGAMLLHVANQIPLADHGSNVIHGISGDDERSHPGADGVELPLADAVHDHHHGASSTTTISDKNPHYWPSAPEDGADSNAAPWWDLGNTVSVIGLLTMLAVLFGLVLWEWYRHSKKRRRSYGGGDYRRVDTNGGILGNVAASTATTTPFSFLSSPIHSFSASLTTLLDDSIMALKQITARPMIVLRYWTSRVLSHRNGGDVSGGSTDDTLYHATGLDPLETSRYYYPQQDPVSMATYQQQLLQQQHSQFVEQQQQQQQQQPPSQAASPLHETLGPSTKSPSMISMKYWRKKRYSGDSHRLSQLIQPAYDNDAYDYGGATSAMYATRSNSASNLVARTSSPLLSGEGPASSMSRSRSRANFTLESFEEGGDYLTSTAASRTPSPVTLISKRMPSPRSSLENP
jgi:hypothetical protein